MNGHEPAIVEEGKWPPTHFIGTNHCVIAYRGSAETQHCLLLNSVDTSLLLWRRVSGLPRISFKQSLCGCQQRTGSLYPKRQPEEAQATNA